MRACLLTIGSNVSPVNLFQCQVPSLYTLTCFIPVEAAEALAARKLSLDEQQAELSQQRRELRQLCQQLDADKREIREEMSQTMKQLQTRLESQYGERCTELLNAVESR